MSQSTVRPLSERGNKLDSYLLNQVKKTGAQVRVIDLFTCSMKLIAGLLGALFLFAIIDSWVITFSGWARWLALILLVGGGVTYFVMAILPLLIRRINPVYAAQVVESSQDGMKNSLINYLLLRHQAENQKVPRRVMELVGFKAANDISGVPVEKSVDKSHTIQAALILTALVVLLGAYKVMSPKDPFQSFARMLAPASGISKPARVRITDVSPGNQYVYFGQSVTVTAFINGKFDPNTAKVVFSTLNGQIVDAAVPMEPQQDKNYFQCELKTSERGIEQSVRYKVVAGDGESSEFTLKMRSAPVLSVESIHYEPPAYTEEPPSTDTRSTTIDHIEGTSVTIDAVANADIRSGFLQRFKEQDGQFIKEGSLQMEQLDERHARFKFKLARNLTTGEERYTHYQLNLITANDGRSQPVGYNRINVRTDSAPDIAVVHPLDNELSVPVNSRIRFELHAQDDFKIQQILAGINVGQARRIRDEELLPPNEPLKQKVEVVYEFWPDPDNTLIRPGDVVFLQFGAVDNRRPRPNLTQVPPIKITITEPIEDPPQRGEEGESSEESSQDGNDEGEGEGEDSSENGGESSENCLLYTSPSPRDRTRSRMPSSA